MWQELTYAYHLILYTFLETRYCYYHIMHEDMFTKAHESILHNTNKMEMTEMSIDKKSDEGI